MGGVLTNEQQLALNAWNVFVIQHSKAAQGKGTSGNPGKSMEAQRGILYQRCVRLGIKPQLKRKYRGAHA